MLTLLFCTLSGTIILHTRWHRAEHDTEFRSRGSRERLPRGRRYQALLNHEPTADAEQNGSEG